MSSERPRFSLFAYGTLQDKRVMRAVTGKEFPARVVLLKGYRRNRVTNTDYPGIVADSTQQVAGQLLQGVDEDSLHALDRFEGEYYERHTVEVSDQNGILHRCDVYVIAPQWQHILGSEAWSLEEFQRIGYQRFRDNYPNF